jgi:retron-type reverse transcriptase
MGIKVNDQVGPNIQTKKGVRQGDPLSPILFNIVIDMIAILIKHAKERDQIKGMVVSSFLSFLLAFRRSKNWMVSKVRSWKHLFISFLDSRFWGHQDFGSSKS